MVAASKGLTRARSLLGNGDARLRPCPSCCGPAHGVRRLDTFGLGNPTV